MRSIQRSDVQNAVRLALCAALVCGPSQWAAAGQSEPTAIGEVVVTAQKRE